MKTAFRAIAPVLDLSWERILRLHAQHTKPLAPADIHLKTAIRLADIQRRAA